jgi:hypothetical protein
MNDLGEEVLPKGKNTLKKLYAVEDFASKRSMGCG